MSPDAVAPWLSFFSVCVGAAATLTGRLFVAVSINLSRLVTEPALLARAAETVVALLLALVICCLPLAPGSTRVLGAALTVVCAVTAAVTLRVQLRHGPDRPDDPLWWFLVRVATVQVVSLPGVAGGLALLVGVGSTSGSLRVVAAGVLLGFTFAVYGAWVLLVEVVRQERAR